MDGDNGVLLQRDMASSLSNESYGLIILGNSGVGKSFLANILLGQDIFAHAYAARAVTTETEFQEVCMGDKIYAIFNVPGLIEADQQRVDMNKREIDKAFKERPTSLVIYVFGQQNGRIRDEDIVAFNALNKAYPFDIDSLILVVNSLAKDRPENYEGEAIVLLEQLIKVPCQNVCFLDTIDKKNVSERESLNNKLLQAIVERTAHNHSKKQDIDIQSVHVREAKELIKTLQKEFQQNKDMYKKQILEQQIIYNKMFAEIRNENESMRRLIERQSEQAQTLQERVHEQEKLFKKDQERRDTEHQNEMRRLKEVHEKAIREANIRVVQQNNKEQQSTGQNGLKLKVQKSIDKPNDRPVQQNTGKFIDDMLYFQSDDKNQKKKMFRNE
ncbi:hypothetical protein I4U23_023200 [Adineta vaga]|nr:hypothetical protein I4U23_023200 [Adineta vaga]